MPIMQPIVGGQSAQFLPLFAVRCGGVSPMCLLPLRGDQPMPEGMILFDLNMS